jgi:D-xylose transport system substrate-binding protein
LAAVLAAVLASAALTGLVAGCAASAQQAKKPEVGVILPSASVSPRWENADGLMLERFLLQRGVDPDVENVDGDAGQWTQQAIQMINDGAKALIVAAPDLSRESAVVNTARAKGIPTLDYNLDGAISPADYALDIDYRQVGELEGRGLVQGLRSTSNASVIALGQAPTDAAGEAINIGQQNILKPRFAKDYQLDASQELPHSGTDPSTTLAGTMTGVSPAASSTPESDKSTDPTGSAVTSALQQFLASHGDSVDGVLAANDDVAAAALTVLRTHDLIGKVTVTGFGATTSALQAILRGEQFMTAYVPVETQSGAAAALAAALAQGDQATAVRMTTAGPGHTRTVSLASAPISLNTIKSVFDSDIADPDSVCTDDLKLRCNQLNIS